MYETLALSGDGVPHFSRLISAGLATYTRKANNMWELVTYAVTLTEKGRQLITAWRSGNRESLKMALNETAIKD